MSNKAKMQFNLDSKERLKEARLMKSNMKIEDKALMEKDQKYPGLWDSIAASMSFSTAEILLQK